MLPETSIISFFANGASGEGLKKNWLPLLQVGGTDLTSRRGSDLTTLALA
jgi:hypothetical protein